MSTTVETRGSKSFLIIDHNLIVFTFLGYTYIAIYTYIAGYIAILYIRRKSCINIVFNVNM